MFCFVFSLGDYREHREKLTLESSDPAKSAGLVTQCLVSLRTCKIYFLSEVTFTGISGAFMLSGFSWSYVENGTWQSDGTEDFEWGEWTEGQREAFEREYKAGCGIRWG